MEQKLPKNMCCIGEAGKDRKIFVEEYVISFLLEMADKTTEPQMIVFYGDGYEKDGCQYYFLQGVASHKATEGGFGRIDEFYFQNIGKKYFSELKGIGWYHTGKSEGQEGVLDILRNIREQDFGRINGYYIYYEKNPAMEEYMLNHEQFQTKDACVNREVKREKAEKVQYEGRKSVKKRLLQVKNIPMGLPQGLSKHGKIAPVQAVQILNMVSLCILIICCIIAVTTINQYDKMKRLEKTVNYLEASMEMQEDIEERESEEKQKNLPKE